jgi:peptidoglycan hydrolase CwlO-like protein
MQYNRRQYNKRRNLTRIISIILVISFLILPIQASGKVQPITDVEEKLRGITEEEKVVLEELFAISQEIDEMEREEKILSTEIASMQLQINGLEEKIELKQRDYNFQLDILKKVLVNYQRGGPASYLEILLSADNLTMFLKSINIIKDISRNVSGLLTSLENSKKELESEKDKLVEAKGDLDQKRQEQQESIRKKLKLKQKQEDYLATLQEQQIFYKEQLSNLENLWKDSKSLFSDVVNEISQIVGEGYFTMEDLNLSFGFTSMKGAIFEDVFNAILEEHSELTETHFLFEANQVVIEVPDKHLSLTGNFVIEGDSAIRFDVTKGSFYNMSLEAASIDELFLKGPLLIDFKKMSGDLILNFTLQQVVSEEGQLTFVIKPEW